MILHCISGLPRSGSTLLANILAQNPRLTVSGTSGVLDVVAGIRNHWDGIAEFQACPDDAAKMRVMRGVLESFYAGSAPVVIDKCRGWLAWIEWLEAAFERQVKMLVPVRDMRDVLASMERLHRQNFLRAGTVEKDAYLQQQAVDGRCQYWLRYDQPVGIAYNRIRDALHRGFADQIHFVRFEDLTTDPAQTLRGIYDFLGEDGFDHRFSDVQQTTVENDTVYGMGDLHTIRLDVQPVESQWHHLLGEQGNQALALNALWQK